MPSVAVAERKRAKEFFPSEGNVEVGSDGVMRKKLTTEEKAEVAWKEKKHSLLLVHKFEVKRKLIVRSDMLHKDAKSRQLVDFDSRVVMQFQEMLDATGSKAVVRDKGLEWRQTFVASDSQSIEDERLMELELAHFAIVRLCKLLKEHALDISCRRHASGRPWLLQMLLKTGSVGDRLVFGDWPPAKRV